MSIEIYVPFQADRAVRLAGVDARLHQIRQLFGVNERPVIYQRESAGLVSDLIIDRQFIRGVERIAFSLWEDLATDPVGKALADSILKR